MDANSLFSYSGYIYSQVSHSDRSLFICFALVTNFEKVKLCFLFEIKFYVEKKFFLMVFFSNS